MGEVTRLPAIEESQDDFEFIVASDDIVANLTIAVRNEQLPPEVIQQIILLSFFTVFALSGNIALLVHLIRNKAWTRPVTIFVMALAMTDILIATFSMSIEILWEAFNEWIFGYYACKIATYTQCALFVSTAFILMSMSYDRFQAICRPMLFCRSLSRSRKMILGSWLTGIVLAIPQLFIFVQVEVGTHPDGDPIYACKSAGYTAAWQRKIYVTWIATCVFIVPLCFVAICYVNIARVVWTVTSHPLGHQQRNETMMLRVNSSASQRVSDRAKIKTIKLTISILACYILCWTPYFSMNLLNVWTNYYFRDKIPAAVQITAQSMAWFSSCVNPLIYGGFLMPDKACRDCIEGSPPRSPKSVPPLSQYATRNGCAAGKSRSPSPAIQNSEKRSRSRSSSSTVKGFSIAEEVVNGRKESDSYVAHL